MVLRRRSRVNGLQQYIYPLCYLFRASFQVRENRKLALITLTILVQPAKSFNLQFHPPPPGSSASTPHSFFTAHRLDLLSTSTQAEAHRTAGAIRFATPSLTNNHYVPCFATATDLDPPIAVQAQCRARHGFDFNCINICNSDLHHSLLPPSCAMLITP